MMATVPHVTSGLGLRKFQADGFLLTRVYIASCGCLLNTPSVFEVVIVMNHISVETGVSKCSKLWWNCLLCTDYDPERPHGVISCAYLCFVLVTRKPDVLNGKWVVTGGVTCQPMA